MSEEKPRKRPTTVTFNVEYNRAPTRASTRTYTNTPTELSHLRPVSRKANLNIKTADLSHMTDSKATPNVPTFIPEEFKREVQTPIPVRVDLTTTYQKAIFPSPIPNDSRQEVENLGQWLNSVLEKNQKETKDPIQLATNARHWFTIAYEELCRQVSAECPERSTLLLSIWKRYQALFARVVQLHQEEKTYLVTCHKERTSTLKAELDQTQAKLKQITQQYRDDQERWSNSRERDETKFANMRKKLDLQVKNKRSLTMQIKALKEQLEGRTILGEMPPENAEEKEENPKTDLNETETKETQEGEAENSNNAQKKADENKEDQKPKIDQHTISDKVHQLRQKVRTEYPTMFDALGALDDISKFVDQQEVPSNSTREIFPSLLHELSAIRMPRIRSLKWIITAMTYFYSIRLTEICKEHQPLEWSPNRQHFANSIYEQLLVIFGSPAQASETFFDLVETARHFVEKENNIRCRMFLQFLDVLQPYRDCVYLDFYCFCLGSFLVSNTAQHTLFFDNFEEEKPELSMITANLAIEQAKKVLYTVSEGNVADGFVRNMKEELKIGDDLEAKVSGDSVLDFLMGAFAQEEVRMTDQLREQYEMDAAQYGGIVTLGQFQTLAMFSSKKFDQRGYTEMMRDTMIRTSSKTVSFQGLIDTMHRNGMLVPVSFERIDYSSDEHLDDVFGFMKEEYAFHEQEIENKLESLRKSDENMFTQLTAAKSKFEQVVETKRTGLFTEVAQREFYEKLSSIQNELFIFLFIFLVFL